MNVTLQEDTQALDEVVVVGYGAERKPLMAGAVSDLKVNHKKIFNTKKKPAWPLTLNKARDRWATNLK